MPDIRDQTYDMPNKEEDFCFDFGEVVLADQSKAKSGRKAQRKGRRGEKDALKVLRSFGYDVFRLATPYAIIQTFSNGSFHARRIASSGVDIAGTCPDGRAIFVEVKNIKCTALPVADNGIKPTQLQWLLRHERKGAKCFICWNEKWMNSFDFNAYMNLNKRKSVPADQFKDFPYDV